MRRRRMLARQLRLPGALRSFLREQATIDDAERALGEAIASREARFLELAYTQIYGRLESPYLRLLTHAGCSYGDLEQQVRCEGLDATLERLAGEGVYLTDAESKGRKDVLRGSLAFRVDPGSLLPSTARVGFQGQSSGSRGAPVRAVGSFDWMTKEAPAVGVFLAANGLLRHVFAAFEPMAPGAAGMLFLLEAARFGIPTDRWFCRAVASHSRLERAFYRLTAWELVALSRLFGPGIGRPRLVNPADPSAIVDWASGVARSGQRACIRTVASNAARIARAAREAGVSLEGTTFIASGEPVTEAKRKTIEEAGGRTVPLYGFTPGLTHFGFGCGQPLHTDDMHVNEHTLAVVEHPTPIVDGESPIRPLLVTTLYPSAARALLNVALGDYAVLERRACGCALGRAGLSLHVHRVRSYEKLASEGMNYVFDNLHEALEEVLPARLGGGPGDYQLVEEEDRGGQTRLTLLIAPTVGTVDQEHALAVLREALAGGAPGPSYMVSSWEQYGTLRVRREVPRTSSRGKVLPLHIER